jgi:hypothetical protein
MKCQTHTYFKTDEKKIPKVNFLSIADFFIFVFAFNLFDGRKQENK